MALPLCMERQSNFSAANTTIFPVESISPLEHATILNNHSALFRAPYAVTAIALILTLILTRIASGTGSLQRSRHAQQNDICMPPTVPYWIPFLGHIPHMALNATTFTKRLRQTYNQGIFTLNFGGTRHSIIYHPGLGTALFHQKRENTDAEHVGKWIMYKAFGYPPGESEEYDAVVPDLTTTYKYLITEPHLGCIVDETCRRMKTNIANLVTFTTVSSGQMPWERSSNVRIVTRPDGGQAVEASLLPMIRDFGAWAATPSIFGPDLLQNFPDLLRDLWIHDNAFMLLGSGLPRWAPIGALRRAFAARDRLTAGFMEFHTAYERYLNGEQPGEKWSNFDKISTFMKERTAVYRKHNFSIAARAANELSIFWASNVNSHQLVFWMLSHIYKDPELLATLREEVSPYIEVVRTGAEPPELGKVDVEGICKKCPLLKSCFVECLRVDTGSWTFKVVKQDFVLNSREQDAQPYLLRKGDFVHVAHDLHNTDPNYFENPAVWKVDRHVKYDENHRPVVDMGSLRPFGGGSSMCKGRALAAKTAVLFTAAIITLWEMEPADTREWKIPGHRVATGTYGSTCDSRVLLSRRQFD